MQTYKTNGFKVLKGKERTYDRLMKRSKFLFINYTMIMIGSVVGAGFATGKEVVTFFGIYSKFAPHIIVVAGIGFFFATKAFFEAGKHPTNKAVEFFFSVLIFIAEFILLSTMISALFCITNIFLSNTLLAIVLMVVSFVIGIFGLKGLLVVNVALVPLLILAIVSVSVYFMVTQGTISPLIESSNIYQRISYPFLYFGMNLFTSFPICKELGRDMTKKEINKTSIFTAVFITVCIMLIYYVIAHSSEVIFNSEMPLAILSSAISPALGLVYFFVIVISILMSLISSLFILNTYHGFFKIDKFNFSLILLIFSYLLSNIGFGNIVTHLYPLIGIFGVMLFVYSVIHNKKSDKKLSLKSAKKRLSLQK